MSAHDPQDQHHDAPVPPAVTAGADAAPSVRDLLAACAAARTVSTPPRPDDGADPDPGAPHPSGARPGAGRRDAA
jgi:hypothetical protein